MEERILPDGHGGAGAIARGRRVTNNDLAADLGLANGTVSRALNGYPDNAEATCLKVHKRTEVLGDRPLAQAQRFRTGRTRSLGLVFRIDLGNSQRPFLSDFLAGVTRRASAGQAPSTEP